MTRLLGRALATTALVACLFGTAHAQQGGNEEPPLPPGSAAPVPAARPEPPQGGDAAEAPSEDERPEDGDSGSDAEETRDAEATEDTETPEADVVPEPRSDEAGSDDADPAENENEDDVGPGEPEEPAEPETPPEPDPPRPPEPEDPAELRACRAELKGLGAVFEQLDAIEATTPEENGCGVAAPFAVTEILPGIALEPATEMRCQTALALARWVRDEVLPAADALELGAPTALVHGSTYVCRPRNNLEDAEISEHALGNAIDIMSFTFEDGETISVSPKKGDGDAAEAFQKAVGSGACLHFTTVLGPGSDPYHNDHLHLDIVERNSGFRLCQAP